MNSAKHSSRTLLYALATVVTLVGSANGAPLEAQVEGVRLGLMYQPEYQPGLVVLPFRAEGDASRSGPILRSIINQDLDYSDRFEMLDGSSSQADGSINVDLWKERGADWIVQGSLSAGRAGGTQLRVILHDAVYGSVKEDRTFALPAQGDPNFRMAVHAVSDEVVRWATGEPGAAASRIAFVLDGQGGKELYVIDYDGENVQQLTSDATITLSPAWSPDGSRLAYTSYRNGSPLLYERDLTTGRDRLLSDRAGINITPSYAPDGRTIAFATTVSGNTEIATIGTGGLEQHTRGRGFDSLSPSYSPDGRRFAFVSNRLGEPHIYVMNVGGGEPRLVSDYTFGGQSYNTSPDWSPEGEQIAYHSRVSGSLQIVVADLGTGQRRLLTNDGNNEDPSWAPDGRHVVFSSRDRDGGGLFILDTVSGRTRPLLRGARYGLPDWSPVLREADARGR